MSYKKNTNHTNLCFVAGKTGGHIVPCLTLAEQHIQKFGQATILFFSTTSPLDQKLLASHPLVTHHVTLAFGSTSTLLKEIPRFFSSFFKSLYHLRKHKPEKIISTGGKVAIPVCLGAWLLRIPIELYELNVIPGKAIKLLTSFAQTTFICFEKTKDYVPRTHCVFTHYPVRFLKDHSSIPNSKPCGRKTMLILGGSQGSLFINNLIKTWLEMHPELHPYLFIIHQTGTQDSTHWQQFYKEKNIPAEIFAYHDDLARYYAAADIIICRSGAGTLFEVKFFKKKCITIPLELKSTDHQLDNAKEMVATHPELFILIRQQEIENNQHVFFKALEKEIVKHS